MEMLILRQICWYLLHELGVMIAWLQGVAAQQLVKHAHSRFQSRELMDRTVGVHQVPIFEIHILNV
jgi:hypothetical protein